MKILVVNAGSSSLKYQLIDMDGEKELAKGLVERIGIEGSKLKHSAGEKKTEISQEIPDHEAAAQLMLKILQDPEYGVIKSTDEIGAVGHRVLHGGSAFTASVVVNDAAKQAIRDCFPLGPLHNPANLMGIEACEKVMKGTPQVAVFDTAFHQTMPPKAYRYAIPTKYYKDYAVRKYGFHGTSHSFVSKETIKFLGLDPDNSKVIVAHLGNGASISAVVNGKCADTSMGLTPLEGLVMGTRSGDLDPAVLEFVCKKEGIDVSEMLTILNKKSGVFALSDDFSSDFRDLEGAMSEGNEAAKLAIDAFSYRVIKYIGSYAAAMNGVDAIAFTGGIGENDANIRMTVMESLAYLGVKPDVEKNGVRGENCVITAEDSKVTVCVIPTNEQLAICRETVALIS